MWVVYFLRCSDNSLYCGITNNIEKRIKVHNTGKGAKYTRNKLPVKLVYIQKVDNKSEALKLEYKLKKLTKKEKEKMIVSQNYRIGK